MEKDVRDHKGGIAISHVSPVLKVNICSPLPNDVAKTYNTIQRAIDELNQTPYFIPKQGMQQIVDTKSEKVVEQSVSRLGELIDLLLKCSMLF